MLPELKELFDFINSNFKLDPQKADVMSLHLNEYYNTSRLEALTELLINNLSFLTDKSISLLTAEYQMELCKVLKESSPTFLSKYASV